MVFGQSLTLSGTVTSNPSEAGIYTGAYPFTFTSGSTSTSINAVCDDFADEIYVGESWKVTVTPFSSLSSTIGTNNASVMWGGGAINGQTYSQSQLYDAAAYLVGLMNNSAYSVSNLSYAIWQIFDPPGNSDNAIQWLTQYDGTNAASDIATVNSYIALALANYGKVNPSDFEVLTPVSGSQIPSGDGRPQEFIYEIQTPETSAGILFGADMLGLLGLAIVFRRRLLRPLA
jgi:hypothetical protein